MASECCAIAASCPHPGPLFDRNFAARILRTGWAFPAGAVGNSPRHDKQGYEFEHCTTGRTMKITIQGLDYSASLDAGHPLTIERKLNEPALCQFQLSLSARGNLAAPLRNQSVSIAGDDGTQYFTGYVASNPLPEYAGLAIDGPRFRFVVCALSDEILIDQLPTSSIKAASGMTAGQLMTSLVLHTRSTTLGTQGLTLNAPVSNFAAAPGATWSQNAGHV